MAKFYKLVGHKAVPCDLMTWADSFEDFKQRIVKYTKVSPTVDVSTVFLGLNHQFGIGPPLIFETMIFGGTHEHYQMRYSTWDEAEAGHAMALNLVTETISPNVSKIDEGSS